MSEVMAIKTHISQRLRGSLGWLVPARASTRIFFSLALIFGLAPQRMQAQAGAGKESPLSVTSVTVRNKTLPANMRGGYDLGAAPESIVFRFEPATTLTTTPKRLRYRLEGYDKGWREGSSEMSLKVRFVKKAGDLVQQVVYGVRGESAGWNGSVKTSALTHRRESLTVPMAATRLMLTIASAGPPAAEGVYVVAHLTVLKNCAGQTPASNLLQSPLDLQPKNTDLSQPPSGWIRDGTHATMAKIVEIGDDPSTRAFAIYDDDPIGHAEWRNTTESAVNILPGDVLTIEWDEMYNIGFGETRIAAYDHLPPGNYTFELEELNVFGNPTGVRTSVNLVVPPQFWRTVWFWEMGSIVLGGLIFCTVRYFTRLKMQREMHRLKAQQALQQERLRIAQDIHDDLGARITEISMLSAMAEDNSNFTEEAREEFGKVSEMCREVVFALYETVWTVNPENDNLNSLVNYLCQIVDRLCDKSKFRCRFYVSDLPQGTPISSSVRHNVAIAVKEAVQNVIKQAEATEVDIEIRFANDVLCILVHGNSGEAEKPELWAADGLAKLQRRIERIGGEFFVETKVGEATTVHIRLTVTPNASPASRPPAAVPGEIPGHRP